MASFGSQPVATVEDCHRGEYANVLLAAKGPCASSAVQALQTAPSSVASVGLSGPAHV